MKDGLELIRPRELYSPANFKTIHATFSRHFPDYLFHCPHLGKTVIAVPIVDLDSIYTPQKTLQILLTQPDGDSLQLRALRLVKRLSQVSRIPLEDFGIHGSLSLNMHSHFSDIDLSVYGANNFQKVKDGVHKLIHQGELNSLYENDSDQIRENKGQFEGTKFVLNAIRKYSEITEKYGDYSYTPIRHVKFICEINENREGFFKPAVYGIANCNPPLSSLVSDLNEDPTTLVSMIGRYRGIAKKGQSVQVSGMLEKVMSTNGTIEHRVVIGSGEVGEEEYVWPISH
jgi:predicted nucleotidyltransferase